MARDQKKDRTNALSVVGLALAVGTLLWTFRDSEPERIASLLRRVGGAGVLILLPQGLSLLVESWGWRAAFDHMGCRLPLRGLFRARLATEALAQTLPMGVVFCESMKPMLLARTCGAELSTSLAGMAVRKWLLVGSQGLYVSAFALLGFPVLARISGAILGGPGLPYALGGAALLLLLLAIATFALLARGRVGSRVHGMLTRLPSKWLRRRLSSLETCLADTDGQLQTFFATVGRSPLPVLAFLLGWLLEAADTWLILHLLGVRLPWATVGALEVSASFLRNVVFMVPAGLGVQDLSYLAFLRALNVADALNVTAAFLLLKRCKECVWATAGYAILAFELRPHPKPAEQAC